MLTVTLTLGQGLGGGDKNAIAPIYNQSGVSGQCIGKEKLIAIELLFKTKAIFVTFCIFVLT